MRLIYHVAYRSAWERARREGEYRESTRGLTLDEVGFIHASEAHQVERVANAFYAGEPGLVVLVIDADRVAAEVRPEAVPGWDDPLPHIHGPLHPDAVVDTLPLTAGADGRFRFADQAGAGAAPPGCRLRPAAPAEAAEVLALWREAGAEPTVTDDEGSVTRLIESHPDALLVAELDGRIVGTLIAAFDGWRAHLYRLAVRPAHRRRGIARALVQEAARRLGEGGARRVSALVVRDDPGAMAFGDGLSGDGLRRDPLAKERFVLDLHVTRR